MVERRSSGAVDPNKTVQGDSAQVGDPASLLTRFSVGPHSPLRGAPSTTVGSAGTQGQPVQVTGQDKSPVAGK